MSLKVTIRICLSKMKVVLALLLIFVSSIEAKKFCKKESGKCPDKFKYFEVVVSDGNCPSVDDVIDSFSKPRNILDLGLGLIFIIILFLFMAEFTWSTYGWLESHGRLIRKFQDKFFLHFLLKFSRKWRNNLSWNLQMSRL